MPRRTTVKWDEARALREAGMSLTEVAARVGVHRSAVSRKAKAEGWGDGADLAEALRRKVTEKTHGIGTGDPVKKAAAMDAAAEKGASIVARHREDWENHHATYSVQGIAQDFDLGKSAKICAEMLAIRQRAERIAWGLEEAEGKPDITIQWAGLG